MLSHEPNEQNSLNSLSHNSRADQILHHIVERRVTDLLEASRSQEPLPLLRKIINEEDVEILKIAVRHPLWSGVTPELWQRLLKDTSFPTESLALFEPVDGAASALALVDNIPRRLIPFLNGYKGTISYEWDTFFDAMVALRDVVASGRTDYIQQCEGHLPEILLNIGKAFSRDHNNRYDFKVTLASFLLAATNNIVEDNPLLRQAAKKLFPKLPPPPLFTPISDADFVAKCSYLSFLASIDEHSSRIARHSFPVGQELILPDLVYPLALSISDDPRLRQSIIDRPSNIQDLLDWTRESLVGLLGDKGYSLPSKNDPLFVRLGVGLIGPVNTEDQIWGRPIATMNLGTLIRLGPTYRAARLAPYHSNPDLSLRGLICPPDGDLHKSQLGPAGTELMTHYAPAFFFLDSFYKTIFPCFHVPELSGRQKHPYLIALGLSWIENHGSSLTREILEKIPDEMLVDALSVVPTAGGWDLRVQLAVLLVEATRSKRLAALVPTLLDAIQQKDNEGLLSSNTIAAISSLFAKGSTLFLLPKREIADLEGDILLDIALSLRFSTGSSDLRIYRSYLQGMFPLDEGRIVRCLETEARRESPSIKELDDSLGVFRGTFLERFMQLEKGFFKSLLQTIGHSAETLADVIITRSFYRSDDSNYVLLRSFIDMFGDKGWLLLLERYEKEPQQQEAIRHLCKEIPCGQGYMRKAFYSPEVCERLKALTSPPGPETSPGLLRFALLSVLKQTAGFDETWTDRAIVMRLRDSKENPFFLDIQFRSAIRHLFSDPVLSRVRPYLSEIGLRAEPELVRLAKRHLKDPRDRRSIEEGFRLQQLFLPFLVGQDLQTALSLRVPEEASFPRVTRAHTYAIPATAELLRRCFLVPDSPYSGSPLVPFVRDVLLSDSMLQAVSWTPHRRESPFLGTLERSTLNAAAQVHLSLAPNVSDAELAEVIEEAYEALNARWPPTPFAFFCRSMDHLLSRGAPALFIAKVLASQYAFFVGEKSSIDLPSLALSTPNPKQGRHGSQGARGIL